MEHLIAWCGFLGAWLLVAGPIYQAAIDLADEELEREVFERARAVTEPAEHPSRWWLLIPPAAWLLRHRARQRWRERMLGELDAGQVESLMHFGDTASAWLFVGSGAFLIAVKETWELHEVYEWEERTFWILVVAMLIVCAANVVLRVRRREGILERVTET